ncbi:Tfp pilus assembly protein, ATPase PilM-like protein [Alkalihalophilus pseudofirmus OF4]|uniref:Tfp pilus assembly protein, ATPase PilM-like protein n=1 Tax=Alkalihalophilus pseudofirmus (strain ATCC BAA-2126 / JCM 17055 / OF4) TaxID=398511 RepID=D3FWA5_ALKPO|nr:MULTISPECIES: pilus assembly protein PilM [Alkalihalophilus]ADC48637.1 Tfp pilus assembly protein, ATPase PilM-like protein [Alkalihalophilus pseudofirmus OF4]MED1602930.1 pilus assembly protein PilM [Alkalihalophilus marmarensis]
MNLFQQTNQKRHAFIIKDHVIRYIGSKQPDLLQITQIKERYLPLGIVVNGQIEDMTTFVTILTECVEEWKLKRQRIQFCLPQQHTIIRTHFIDGTIPDEEVKGQLYLDLGESLLLPFDDPIFDFKVIGMHDGQKEVLLFASRESVLNQYIDAFSEVHLKPNAADLSTLSAYRLFFENGQVQTGAYVIQVQIDAMVTTITIFKDHHPLFLSTILSELDQEGWSLTGEGDVTRLTWTKEEEEMEEAIEECVREVEKVMNFYQFNVLKGEGEMGQMLLCGDHPYLTQFEAAFSERLMLEIVGLSEQTKNDAPVRYYDAQGLVLKKEVYR